MKFYSKLMDYLVILQRILLQSHQNQTLSYTPLSIISPSIINPITINPRINYAFFRKTSEGESCKVLKLRSRKIRELKIHGSFEQLHTLILDFCTSLHILEYEDSFVCMPKLTYLSMCETKIGNLWTTTAALSKVPSLLELRFQKCLCCNITGPCPVSLTAMDKLAFDFSPSDSTLGIADWEFEDCPDESSGASAAPIQYVSRHPSPICFEKNYRAYVIFSLPRLVVLDNLLITDTERKRAKPIVSEHYELLPYNRQRGDSLVNILYSRETGSNKTKPSCKGKGQYFYSRSLCAYKFGGLGRPVMDLVSGTCPIALKERKGTRTRQFEFHPSNSSLMVFGTLDGEIVVTNHETNRVLGYVPPLGDTESVLGLCWLKKYPSKFLAGSDNGSVRLYDVNDMLRGSNPSCSHPTSTNFDDFEQLTCLHANSTDDWFVTSGYSNNVALYDIGSGKRLEQFTDMHRGPINVIRFANHSPSMFVTSSFDRDVKMWDTRQSAMRPCYTVSSARGNVMVSFSPDDLYLLVSAVDNEVKQLMAADGKLHTEFEITSTGSSYNYTRSYYMNGRDYIISGSSDESVVRICCAQTGRRLRDVHFEDRGSPMFVQSLRSNPVRHFQMAVLATSSHTSSNSDIIKVNLLASSHDKIGQHSYS